ncbi:carbohydrate porin, partial [Acetobacter lovaniensis]
MSISCLAPHLTPPGNRHKNRAFSKTVFVSLTLSLLSSTAAFAQNAETQLEQDRRRLGNSGPLVSEVDPATVRDSMRAAEAAATAKNDEDHPDLSDHLLGNMWGARDWMGRHGVTFDLQEVDELWGNTSGGTASSADGPDGSGTGPSYNGMTMPTLTVDMEKFIGLKGGIFNISA